VGHIPSDLLAAGTCNGYFRTMVPHCAVRVQLYRAGAEYPYNYPSCVV
jgi:hypothetical protein